MSAAAKIQLHIAPDGEHPEDTDRFARDLLAAVRDLPVDSAEFGPAGTVPAGSKGATLAAIGGLVLGVGTNAVWDVIKLLVVRLRTRRNTVIRLDGPVGSDLIRFEGTPAEFERLVAALVAARRPAEPPSP